jgi:hypothetical protein
MACGLNCTMMTMGCPTGMTCVAGFGGGRGMTAPSYCQSM